ncbi:MAG: amino acid adenylation domain-containing protein [bacterium]|nr:amino acid adenylation domain-containing protein [bacterium]
MSGATREELFRMLLEEQGLADVSAEAQPVREDGADIPLSFSQRRLWFLDRLEPGGSVYTLSSAIRLRGILNLTALNQSYNEIIRRHDILRTTFEESGGEPRQVVHPFQYASLKQIDLAACGPDDAASRLNELQRQCVYKAFDLTAGPLLETILVQTCPEDYILLSAMHHIISDGWSFGVLIREFTELYRAFSHDEPSPLLELPAQYADYALWQSRHSDSASLAEAAGYWKNQLAGSPEISTFPEDYIRPAVQSFQGGRVEFHLDENIARSIHRLCERQNLTPFMAMLTPFAALLHVYSGMTDLVIGTNVANRSRPEWEPLIGFFVNNLALRFRFELEMSFDRLMDQCRGVAVDAFSCQDFPFERVVEILAPSRDPRYHPVFQVNFILQNAAPKTFHLPGLQVEPLPLQDAMSPFDLTLSIEESAGGYRGEFLFNRALYRESSVERFAAHYRELLDAMLNHPGAKVKTALASRIGADAAWLTHGPHDSYDPTPLHVFVEEQVKRTPDQVAVRFLETELTYAEMNERANRLANGLLRNGLPAEPVIAVCLERSLDMPVALLAALKTGGAWLPLDPGDPPYRLAQVLEDARPSVILTHSSLLDRLDADRDQIIPLDQEWPQIEQASVSNPDVDVQPDRLAYIIFTSGSTGRPKGVMIPHRAIVNHMRWMNGVFPLTPNDRVLQKTPFGFDASVWEFFAPWLGGAALVVAPPGEHRDAAALIQTIRSNNVTVLQTVPSLLRMLLEEPSFTECVSLQRVFCGGEPLSRELVNRCRAALGVKPINLYGPTETCIESLYWETEIERDAPRVPIGRPVTNTTVFILDNDLNPLPPGAIGELCIAGAGLARGYYNRPSLTAERFIPNPWADQSGERLYRTGDLARVRYDGLIECLGRVDDQIKIRGRRIELGEIESAIKEHSAIREAAVCLKEDSRGSVLIAYISLTEPDRFSTSILREFLKARLSVETVPTHFSVLDSMPMTSSGKIDRRALAAFESNWIDVDEKYSAPVTPGQQMLAAIWSRVLDVDLREISLRSNFFDLGGHSLLIARVAAQVRDVYSVDIPIREFFNHPTLEELAQAISTYKRGNEEELLSFCAERPDVIPLSFTQSRLWFLDRLEGDRTGYNIPSAARIEGALDVGRLRESLTLVMRRHESLRTVFRQVNNRPAQIIAEPGLWFDCEDLSTLPAHEIEVRLRDVETQIARTRFDLENGPLFRIALFQIENAEYVLYFVIHHIVSDAGSARILIRDVAEAYQALTEERTPNWSAIPFQYADYAVWQQQALSGNVLTRLVDDWLEIMKGAPGLIALPTDRPRPAAQTYRGGAVPFAINAELTRDLRLLARECNATLYMTVLAAFYALLSRLTNETDLVTGAPVANRDRSETEHVVGAFLNMLPVRVDLSGDPSIRDLIARVRRVTLEAFDRQRMPFELLVEKIQPERSLGYHPVFQVMFNWINEPPYAFQMADVSVTPMRFATASSKYDLTFTVSDDGESLSGEVEYSIDLWEAETACIMAQRFLAVLRDAVNGPDQPLSRIECMSPEERNRLESSRDVVINEGWMDEPVWRRFERQVERRPDAVACSCGDEMLSYAELNRRVNRLTRILIEGGARFGSRVGVMMDRGTWLPAAWLAVMKTGAAYVPVDPWAPAERNDWILNDAGTDVVLMDRRYPGVAQEKNVIVLDELKSRIDRASGENPAMSSILSAAAYIRYTSGSTGRPKGVVISHASLANVMESMRREPGLNEEDRLLAVTTPSFDIAELELTLPLTVGARIIMARREETADARRLAEMISTHRVTVMQATPAMWRMLLASGWHGEPELNAWCGGEAMPRELADRLLDRCARLWNLYGPTETTIWSTVESVRPVNASNRETIVPIGSPVANTRVYVLDRNLNEQPLGVWGQVYIAGAGVASGYWRRPDLTASRFLPDLFGEPGSRMYWTGDVGRWTVNGRLEFMGRDDDQVKIRGYRIELGEIESVMLEHPAIQAAAVVVRDIRPGDPRIAAYFVVQDTTHASADELRAFMRDKLPEYMVPAFFIPMPSLPLTPNAKVDRRALPDPVQRQEHISPALVPPQTELERSLAEIWREVLRVESVGVEDNFFDQGGHSLLLIELQTRLRDALNLEISVLDLFRYPNIAALARHLSKSTSRPSPRLDEMKRRAEKRRDSIQKNRPQRKRD